MRAAAASTISSGDTSARRSLSTASVAESCQSSLICCFLGFCPLHTLGQRGGLAEAVATRPQMGQHPCPQYPVVRLPIALAFAAWHLSVCRYKDEARQMLGQSRSLLGHSTGTASPMRGERGAVSPWPRAMLWEP